MFLDALEQYQDIISSYDVLQFRIVGASYQLIAITAFTTFGSLPRQLILPLTNLAFKG
jgi:hypothetical protein